MPVGGKGQERDGPGGTDQGFGFSADLPKDDLPVFEARGKLRPVRRVGQNRRLSAQIMVGPLLAGRGAPNPQGSILAGGGHGAGVRRVDRAKRRLIVGGDGFRGESGRGVPEPQGAVPGHRRQGGAVRREGQGNDGGQMTLQDGFWFRGGSGEQRNGKKDKKKIKNFGHGIKDSKNKENGRGGPKGPERAWALGPFQLDTIARHSIESRTNGPYVPGSLGRPR